MKEYYGITSEELYLFNEGHDRRCYQILGAHPMDDYGRKGVRFAIWCPGVRRVAVTGDFCDWDTGRFGLTPVDSTGVWAGFVPDIGEGALYKYHIETKDGRTFLKSDPMAFTQEMRPGTASKVFKPFGYAWRDGTWMQRRAYNDHFSKALNIYEVHLGSWKQHEAKRASEQDVPPSAFYNYRELASELVPYVKEMGYTHIEMLPVMEHPYDGSWGYQVTGYYAPTSRHGSPFDLMYLIDECHRAGIGVILDWVPGHFCRDSHGLGLMNGEKLYEEREHLQWGTYIFDFSKSEVRSFLLSNAMYWLELYHADGIRVDGVSSMLYLNYGLDDSEPKRVNREGGDSNLEAVSFLREFNYLVGTQFPGVFTIAEESTAWPMVTKPSSEGGLGFHYKWDMGWMNDTLRYMQTDFPWRSGNHRLLTFSMMYAFSENFILPLSHDEVVHGKCSVIGRMPGDYWRQFAGLRMLALYQMTHSGKKLSFMGNEFGQFIEWRFYESLEWFLMKYPAHDAHHEFVKALNHIYLEEPALWQLDTSWDGFRWVDADNSDQSVLVYIRQGVHPGDFIIVAINFATQNYENYEFGVPRGGKYREILNTDEGRFGGSHYHLNPGTIVASRRARHGFKNSVRINLPPLGGVILKKDNSRSQKGTGTKDA